MSNIEIIERLCSILNTAQDIIRAQAEILAAHGIVTDDGALEVGRAALLEDVGRWS